jgi:hypothetical protein
MLTLKRALESMGKAGVGKNGTMKIVYANTYRRMFYNVHGQ